MNHRDSHSKRGATWPLPITLSCSLLVACATPSAARRTIAPDALSVPQLAEREALPDAAREVLHGRMVRHGDQLVDLMTSVLLLDYASTAEIADGIAHEPKLGRPARGEVDTLNALLPAAFFKHQDALAEHARALGQAARAHDDARLAEAFAEVTKTCVGCHAAYLDEDLGFPLHDESERPEDCGAANEPCPVRWLSPVEAPRTRRD